MPDPDGPSSPRNSPSRFGALDAKVRVELRRWLRELHDEMGINTVFVTHDQEEALDLADRVVVMNEGAHRAGQHAQPDL